MFKNISLSHVTTGFVGVLVGFTSSILIVFQAATSAGASSAEISSWVFALGIGLSTTCIGLSLYFRQPILIGWSTPGAALLATGLVGLTMSEAIGIFIFAAVLTVLAGVTGIFERIMAHIPRSLTSAMLAGVLLHFGMDVFMSMPAQLPLICSMLLAYFLGKRFFPRYMIIAVLFAGIFSADIQGLFRLSDVHMAFPKPIYTAPSFTWISLISIGIPLFIVNMTSQVLPGYAVLNNAGYEPRISPIITWTGLTTLILAPFGCFSIGLAALSSAICTNEEADEDPKQRYKATIFAGLWWFAVAVFGASIVALLLAFPRELVAAVAGIALFSTIGSSLNVALVNEKERESAVITVLMSASGITLFGIGSAFWGLIAGVLSSFLLNWHKERRRITQPAA